jgi:hypothetical protein
LASDLTFSGNNILALLFGVDKILISKDKGANWSNVNKNPPAIPYYDGYIDYLCTIGSVSLAFYAGTMYSSYDSGETWQKKGIGPNAVTYPLVFHNKIFTSDIDSGIAVSDDAGKTWKFVYKIKRIVGISDFCTDGKTIFASTGGNGILMSTDSGNTWAYNNDGLSNLNIYSLSLDSEYVYCGDEIGGISRRAISDFFTAIPKITPPRKELFLVKVYPNPMDNVMNIVFNKSLKNGMIVIYNISGKAVRTIKNINSGSYILEKDDLIKGTYLLSVFEGGNKIITQKFQIQ